MKKATSVIFTSMFVVAIFVATGVSSCKKEKSCFSQSLKDASKDSFCTQDCPGVLGCDGKTYCNGCYAAKEGITIIK